jgi:hypothetical protein
MNAGKIAFYLKTGEIEKAMEELEVTSIQELVKLPRIMFNNDLESEKIEDRYERYNMGGEYTLVFELEDHGDNDPSCCMVITNMPGRDSKAFRDNKNGSLYKELHFHFRICTSRNSKGEWKHQCTRGRYQDIFWVFQKALEK